MLKIMISDLGGLLSQVYSTESKLDQVRSSIIK